MLYTIIKTDDGTKVYSEKSPEEVVKEVNENKMVFTDKWWLNTRFIYQVYNHQVER